MPDSADSNRRVLVFFGLIASGKSYLAEKWAEKYGCSYYNTDVVRKELAGLSPSSRQGAALDQGIYSKEQTRRTYQELVRRADDEIRRSGDGQVVLDGSYRERMERDRLVSALQHECRICFIYCRCSDETTRKRLKIREQDPAAVSDGTWDIYLRQKEGFSEPDRIEGARLLKLDTEKAAEILIQEIETFLALPGD